MRSEAAQEVLLEASPTDYWSFDQKNMNDKAKSFLRELKAKLIQLTTPSAEMDASFVYLRMVDQLKWLEPKAGKRRLLTYSDLLENQGEVKFHTYKDDLSLLHENKENLLHKLSQNYPLNDSLKGIKWTNIHQPMVGMEDALHYEATQLFGEHFRQIGLEVEFKASTINTQIPLVPHQGERDP